MGSYSCPAGVYILARVRVGGLGEPALPALALGRGGEAPGAGSEASGRGCGRRRTCPRARREVGGTLGIAVRSARSVVGRGQYLRW